MTRSKRITKKIIKNRSLKLLKKRYNKGAKRSFRKSHVYEDSLFKIKNNCSRIKTYSNFENGLISDLIETICLNLIEWTSTDKRNMSVLIFAILEKFKVNRNDIDVFLKDIDCYSIKTCLLWYEKFMNQDYTGMVKDGRYNSFRSEIYSEYPELEESARLFAFERCLSKTAHFKVEDLASFITKEYLILSDDNSLKPGDYIRSVPSCRLDLIRWGCVNGENKQVSFKLYFSKLLFN